MIRSVATQRKVRHVAAQRNVLACLVVAVAAATAGGPVAAQSASRSQGHDMVHGDHGESYKHRPRWPQATLQAQARAEVAHDTVQLTLATEIADASQEAVTRALTRAVKTAMERALKNADDAGDIKVSSGNYRVWPMNDKDGNISNWRGRGEILLESTNFAAASELAATLADLMPVSSVGFSVSPQTRAAEEQKLLGQAAQAFGSRAQDLAEALGFSGYALRSVDLGGSGAQYEYSSRGMAASPAMFKAADSIPLEGGTETVSVSINGSVFLIDETKEQIR